MEEAEHAASISRYETAERKSRLLGTRRYTRHLLYNQEDDDFDADLHDLTVPTNATSYYEDPFSEANDAEPIEQPENILQFRADIHSETFQSLIRKNVFEAPEGLLNAPADQRALRVGLTGNQRLQDSLLTVHPFRNVSTNQAAFEQIDVVRRVCIELRPLLFVPENCREHIAPARAVDRMRECGCEFVREQRRATVRRLRDCIPSDSERYYRERLDLDLEAFQRHEHFSTSTQSATVVVQQFRCRDNAGKVSFDASSSSSSALGLSERPLPLTSYTKEEEDKRGFRLYVTYFLVEDGMLCFRGFHFAR